MANILPNDNFIIKRRTSIATYLNIFFPNVISKMISEYDYYLEGKATILTDHCEALNDIAIFPDGRIISGSCNGTMKIWNPFGSASNR
jgi:hypothetical protein